MDICMLCKSSKQDDIRYGEFLKNKQFGVHTFCLYLSSNLSQNGDDDEGFLGFLPRDIETEVKRISLLKCCYCYKKFANVGCCETRCRRSFHFICGIENKAENMFCKDFRSYCHKHVRKVEERPSSGENCLICFDRLCALDEKFNKVDMILTPCCRNGWFHKLCIQKFAKTAGYFFKCPLCNDSKVFREKLPAKGIFIPNQDAAWELEPNAFAELLERPNECAAQHCKNKKGRNANNENNPFVICYTCGSTAIHKLCLPNSGRQFNCTDCSGALEEYDSGRESRSSNVNRNDDHYVDVCHVSDKEDMEIINRLFATSSNKTENKRDSGTHNDTDISDEETPRTTQIYRPLENNEKELSSSDSDEYDIRPCASKRALRLRRLESTERSETPQGVKLERCSKTRIRMKSNEKEMSSPDSDGYDVRPCASKRALRLRRLVSSDSSESPQDVKSSCNETKFKIKTESGSSGKIVNRYKFKNRRISNESDKSKTSELEMFEQIKRMKRNLFTDSDDDIEPEKVNASQLNTKAQSLESDRREIRTRRGKRKVLCISDDSDDEITPPKQKCLISENIKKNVQPTTDSLINSKAESDNDSDPLEDFIEFMQRENISCNDKLTVNLYTNKQEVKNQQPVTENKFGQTKSKSNDKNKNFPKLNESDSISKKQHNLEISCIALRTRRKTICGDDNTNSNNNHKMEKQKTQNLNTSCIALRTRRRTICGRTNFDKQTGSQSSEISDFQMSQVYEKCHGSNESLEVLTDCDGFSEHETNLNGIFVDLDPDNFIVDDGYKKSDSKFEISCIANRTRRRKDLKCQRLSKIDEIFDFNSGNSMSSDRCINSDSSEEFLTAPSTLLKVSPPKLENNPAQSFHSILKTNNKIIESSNSRHVFNYHPSTSHHPHSSNRNRI